MAARELAEAGDDVATRLWQVFQEFDANGDPRGAIRPCSRWVY